MSTRQAWFKLDDGGIHATAIKLDRGAWERTWRELAEAPEPGNQHPPTPPPLTGRPKAVALEGWVRETWGSNYSKLPSRDILLKLAREKPEFAKVTQPDVRDIRRSYATKEGKRGGARLRRVNLVK